MFYGGQLTKYFLGVLCDALEPKYVGYMPKSGKYMLKKFGYMPEILGMAFF